VMGNEIGDVRVDSFPFLRATSWITFTASSSCPLPMRYFGDSKMVKRTNRMKNSIREMPPMAIRKYLHPILSER
jgi:hypothetical protein